MRPVNHLSQVINAGRTEFYNKTPIKVRKFENVTVSSVYYGTAYTLVHRLLDDPSGRARLRDYIRDLAGADAREARGVTQEYFGPEVCEHMTSFWIQHVNSRSENQICRPDETVRG